MVKNGVSMVTLFLFPLLAGSIVAFQFFPDLVLNISFGAFIFITGIVATVWLMFSAQNDAKADSSS